MCNRRVFIRVPETCMMVPIYERCSVWMKREFVLLLRIIINVGIINTIKWMLGVCCTIGSKISKNFYMYCLKTYRLAFNNFSSNSILQLVRYVLKCWGTNLHGILFVGDGFRHLYTHDYIRMSPYSKGKITLYTPVKLYRSDRTDP